MSIHYNEADKTLTLQTEHSSYQMKINAFDFLVHTWYGEKIGETDMSYLYMNFDRGFSGNPDDVYPDRTFSYDTVPQEYTGCGVGDFRVRSIGAVNADGSFAADFRYVKHEILPGKYSIPGLPAAYDNGNEAETLIVTLRDKVTGLEADLLYGVFEKRDMITRTVRLRNTGEQAIRLTKAASVCVDFPYGKRDLIHFHGKHTLERQPERNPLTHSVQSIGSIRGTSSHQENPFVILCDRKADEEHGDCYGFMLVYSGSFKAEAELDQYDSARIVMGIQDENFCWKLNPGETFLAPEVMMSYTNAGFTQLSLNYHKMIRNNICRGKYKLARRPILINNWEATYFDFNEEKLLEIAEEAKTLGVEMMVLDDGWFGVRNSDDSGLGDWFVNEEKIGCGLSELVRRINEKGLKFGIWIEPEMVNEDSDLYRAHPDWALSIPGRKPGRSRNQLVLDITRKDVRDYLTGTIGKILKDNNIEYVKWDMNRSINDFYSLKLPKDQQGELAHRYVLGLYKILETFTSEFPDILFEGCSGGGGRFDAGILYYSPQIWCSDDTDPIHRMSIQYGTSFGYPVSTMGAHVSASPNHQTGRQTPINTRSVVAMSGTFGYELDPTSLSEYDKDLIRKQINSFKKYYFLIQNGQYYRLTENGQDTFEAWEEAAEDGSEALLNLVITNMQPNPSLINIRLKGLDPDGIYEIEDKTRSNPENPFGYFGSLSVAEHFENDTLRYTGRALMNGGFTFPWIIGDYPALQIHFVKVND